MNSIPIDQFKHNLQDLIEQVINHHIPLKIADQNGGEFITDWEDCTPLERVEW